MSKDRIDELLEQALVSGTPAEASPVERVEIEQLLAIAGSISALHPAVDAEARAALPTARARFERHVAAGPVTQTGRTATWTEQRPGFLVRPFAVHRRLSVAGSAAIIGLVALLSVFASQSYDGLETASAQVLNQNDYAQIQGVITATSGEGEDRTATLSSDFGEVEVSLGELASVTSADQLVDASTLRAGDEVTVAGTVAKKDKATSIAARTMAILKANAKPPARPKVTLLRELRKGLEGRITVFAVAQDGKSARVLVDAGGGEQFVVVVNARTLGELLNASEAAVGRRVMVSQEPGGPKGEFTLTALNAPAGQPTPIVRPAANGAVAGLVLARDGNVLRVQTDRGPVQVVVTLETRIAIGPEAGLSADRFRGGNLAIGHAVIIQGGVDRTTGRLVADVIWVGAKPTR